MQQHIKSPTEWLTYSNIYWWIFLKQNVSWFKFHQNLSSSIQLTVCQHWYRWQHSVTLYGFLNSLRPRPNRSHFADDIFTCIFLNENVWFPIKISLKFVPKGPINYIPALVQIMAWRRLGDKPLSEAKMVRWATHICVIRPQCVKSQ